MTRNRERNEPTFAATTQDYEATLARISRRRRTKVKTAGIAAGGATVAGIVVGVLLTLGGGGAAEVLKQDQPAGGGNPQPVPTAHATPSSTGSPLSPASNSAGTSAHSTAGTSAQSGLAPHASNLPGSPAPVGRATPSPTSQPSQAGIRRSYSKNNQGAGTTLCNGQGGSQDTFCGNGYASETAIDAEHRVPIQSNVCESAAEISSKTLTFNSSQEVDYAIYQGSTMIWRWSTTKPPARRPGHTLAIDPGQCWYWQTNWRAVDSHGNALHGSFVLRTTSYAKELKPTYNPSSYRFTL